MSQPKHPHSTGSNSYSTGSNKEYFHRSSILHNTKSKSTDDEQNKSKKMGSLKRWFSRLGSSDASIDLNTKREEKAHSQIEDHIAREQQLQSHCVTMLLLGAGGSGKSTVLKQMDKIHNKSKYEHEEKQLKDTLIAVHKNIVLDICDLCKEYYKLKQKQSNIQFASSDVENLAIRIATSHDSIHTQFLTPDLADEIEAIWNTDTMNQVYQVRKKSHIMDNTPYFLNNVHKYADPQCAVTFDDYVRIRDQTTGIVNTSFRTVDTRGKEWLFKMTDVGGQRAERRKWLHVFAGINVVLYVMSLSGYDQVLYEDHDTRCWDETLNLFDKTSKNKSFKRTDFIVFLNKNDIFCEKIKEVPFTVYKEDFDADKAHDGKSVIDWIRHEFVKRFDKEDHIQNGMMNATTKSLAKSNNQKKRSLHFHVTCATDTQQIETVVRIIQLELIRKLMTHAGFLL
eukprot:161851_1